jgi:hypothetical protein
MVSALHRNKNNEYEAVESLNRNSTSNESCWQIRQDWASHVSIARERLRLIWASHKLLGVRAKATMAWHSRPEL